MITFSLQAAAESSADNHASRKGTPDAVKHWTLYLKVVTISPCSQLNHIQALGKEGIPWRYIFTKSLRPVLLY